MKKHLQSYLLKILRPRNEFPTKMTDLNKVQSLINKLHPISCEKKLIRLGPNTDGGYLVPDDFEGIEACFSPGVDTVSGFENDCAELGMKVFLADKSVDGPASKHDLFCFTKKFIGATTNDDFMTLDNWVDSSVSEVSSDLLLQIDIEGAEYEVILSASDSLMKRFRIMVVEFHDLAQLWNKPFFRVAESTFDKILQTHSCLHIHPNNCCGSLRKNELEIPEVMEFTFLRNDRVETSSYQKNFPNSMDFENTANQTLPLPKCWYNSE